MSARADPMPMPEPLLSARLCQLPAQQATTFYYRLSLIIPPATATLLFAFILRKSGVVTLLVLPRRFAPAQSAVSVPARKTPAPLVR